MNCTSFIGRVATDIDMRINGETTVAQFTIAVNRRGKDKGADFFRCKAFGKTAELIERYFHKGSRIGIMASASQPPKYTNKDGVTVYPNVEFIVNGVDFIDTKAESGSQEPPKEQKTDDSFMDLPEGELSELPFH